MRIFTTLLLRVLFVLSLCNASVISLFGQESAVQSRYPLYEVSAYTVPKVIGFGVEYIEDTGATASIRDITVQLPQTVWKTYTKSYTLSFGFQRKPMWFHFALSNTTPQSQDFLLEINFPALDSVELFTKEANGSFSRVVMGDYLPFSMRKIPTTNFVTRISLPDSLPKEFFIRVKTTSSLILPITIYSTENFIEHSNHMQMLFGLMLGILFILILYHFILFLFTFERSYLYYIFYIVCVSFYILTFNGFTAKYLFPNSGFGLQFSTLLSIASSTIGLILFTRSFIPKIRSLKAANAILISIVIYFVVVTISGLFVDYLLVNQVITISFMPGAMVCYIIAIYTIWKERGRRYEYFLVGSLSLIVGGLVAGLHVAGVLPSNGFTTYSVPIGVVVESVLFALALSQRYKILQQEKERAQEETLMLQLNQNALLQQKVQERTEELQQNNLALQDANEEIQRQMVILSEQSVEIELANTALQERNVELQNLNTEKNEIIGIVSHDLKNPIGAVRGLAELIQQRYVDAEQVPEIIKTIVTTSDRMLELVKNLLDVNQLESGGKQFQSASFDIAPMVESSVSQYLTQAAAKNITLHYSAETASNSVVADEQATMQVLDNLISNAVKYSPHGKNVYVRLKASNEEVRVEVQDEGPGISEEDRKKLFGKFSRLSARPTGGEHSTGLGLSIVKKMVEAMGGKVWCESELGKGAAFIVELPKG